jgi:tetratricopeptide (TPR) repeat protein
MRERSEAAISEFQAVADKFGGSVGEKSEIFRGDKSIVDRSSYRDPGTRITVGHGRRGRYPFKICSRRQARAADGQTDEAIALYQELANSSNPVVAKETVQYELAKLYEKQGRKDDAIDTLFTLVKTAGEAKDLEGKSVPLTATAQEAKDKLKTLDPEKAKEIPEPEMPGGISFDN